MTDQLPAIAVLGGGSMGGAILHGLAQPGNRHDGLTVTTRTAAAAERHAGEGVTALALERDPDANRRAVRDAGLVIVGVKPAGVPALLTEIADALPASAVLVSVAVGVTVGSMEALVPNPVLRAMPNTPALVGLGVTGLAAGPRASDSDLELARAAFATVGDVVVVPESQIDPLSTISGSGPAYVFLLMEQLEATARGLGFDAEQARTMVVGTFLGASTLLRESGEEPAELRRRVTSPKGTTERAVAELQAAGVGEAFDRAAQAALARAREIAAGG